MFVALAHWIKLQSVYASPSDAEIDQVMWESDGSSLSLSLLNWGVMDPTDNKAAARSSFRCLLSAMVEVERVIAVNKPHRKRAALLETCYIWGRNTDTPTNASGNHHFYSLVCKMRPFEWVHAVSPSFHLLKSWLLSLHYCLNSCTFLCICIQADAKWRGECRWEYRYAGTFPLKIHIEMKRQTLKGFWEVTEL